jgi:hypothetical protein
MFLFLGSKITFQAHFLTFVFIFSMVTQENGVESQGMVQAVVEKSHSNQCPMKALLSSFFNYIYSSIS